MVKMLRTTTFPLHSIRSTGQRGGGIKSRDLESSASSSHRNKKGGGIKKRHSWTYVTGSKVFGSIAGGLFVQSESG